MKNLADLISLEASYQLYLKRIAAWGEKGASLFTAYTRKEWVAFQAALKQPTSDRDYDWTNG